MTKLNRLDGPESVFHVTSRVNWSAWHLDVDRVKGRLAELIAVAAREFGVVVIAYALMVNHFHLVLQSPAAELFRRLTSRRTACRHVRRFPPGHQNASVIAQFMRRIRATMAHERHRALQLSGHFWEARYDARPVESALSLAVRIAYDHRNPVKAGIVARPENFRWSSARSWATGEQGDIPVRMHDLPLVSDAAEFRRTVLAYQAAPELDRADRLGRILKRPSSPDAIRHELERAGFRIRPCGT